jgi:hypothetical protein
MGPKDLGVEAKVSPPAVSSSEFKVPSYFEPGH